jgi:TonB family protein
MKRSFLQFALIAICLGSCVSQLHAGDDMEFSSRHVHHYVRPSLPETAKRMNLKGIVKLEVEISPAGKVTSIKPVGGHPLLINSAMYAVKAWEFDAAPQTTTAVVSVSFE